MDEELKRTLETLDRVCETRREYGPRELSDELLQLIARAESMPSNAVGTEKGFLERSDRLELEYFRRIWRDNS